MCVSLKTSTNEHYIDCQSLFFFSFLSVSTLHVLLLGTVTNFVNGHKLALFSYACAVQVNHVLYQGS